MLKLENVSKTFNVGTAQEQRVLENFNLTVEDGEFVTVIGGNGAGKSTIMNLISGSLKADSGQIYFDGVDVTGLSEHKRAKYLGRVFQDPRMGTASDMQIDENLALSRRRGKHRGLNWAVNKAEREYFVEKLKELDLGLENRLTDKVGLLSGGQRQAITLLMATINTPKLLLLDEHTAALDPKTAQKVLNYTERVVKEQNLTTIMITHNMQDAIKYGNRLIMLEQGKIVYECKGEEKKSLTANDLWNKFHAPTDNLLG